jgi:hypothetical protein
MVHVFTIKIYRGDAFFSSFYAQLFRLFVESFFNCACDKSSWSINTKGIQRLRERIQNSITFELHNISK